MGLSLRKVPLAHYPARRIALLKPSALGDIVHSLPVLTALRRLHPHAHITWVVNRNYVPLLEGHPDLDAILPFDRAALRRGLFGAVRYGWHFVRRLRRARFDLVIDLQGLLRTGIMALATGAERRVGLGDAREGAPRCYTDVIAAESLTDLHAVERCWQVVSALGGGDLPIRFHVPLQAAALNWAAALLAEQPRPWLFLAAGARWETKRWPPEYFASLVDKALTVFGGTALLIGGPEDVPLSRTVARALTVPVHDLTGQTTLPQLAALLSRADVLLANDSGPLHLAAALGRPVLAPYTCTRAQRHGPYGATGYGVETTVACRGSYRKRCVERICHQDLTPDRLWPALGEVLETWQRQYQAV